MSFFFLQVYFIFIDVFISVDTSDAGPGDLDIQVMCQNQRVPTNVNQLDESRFRFTFSPEYALDHVADINFNYEKIPGPI